MKKALLLLFLTLPLFAGTHPDLLQDLTADCEFPRFTASELEENGYPDHMHRFFWKGYDIPIGPGMFCKNKSLLPIAGLQVKENSLAYGGVSIEYNRGYQPCQIAPALELVQFALDRGDRLLNLKRAGKLHIINPDNNEHYFELTGYNQWRTFHLKGDTCIVSPVPILHARTLIGHSIVDMVTQWLLNSSGEFPDWFVNGVGSYISDMGPHFISYLAIYRPDGGVLFDPMETDMQLYHGVLPDPESDKKGFRIARYSAFIMVWNLVEHRGGLENLQKLIAETSTGTEFSSACEKVYKMPMSVLMREINPKLTGEPIGTNIMPKNPSKPPKER